MEYVQIPQGEAGPDSATDVSPVERVGPQIRARREERNLTVRGLARASGVSPSMISQVELGRASPSVPTLLAITTALHLSLDELFFPSEGAMRRLGARRRVTWEAPTEGAVLRRGNRLRLRLANGVVWELLTSSRHQRLDFLYVTYPVGAQSCSPDDLTRHGGVEHGVLLRGRLGATVNDETFDLMPGDSIGFASRSPHRLWTIGDRPATAVWVVHGRRHDARIAD